MRDLLGEEACPRDACRPRNVISLLLNSASYVRLFNAPEDEIPTTMAQLSKLYEKYAPLFGNSETMDIIPQTGQNYRKLMMESMKKNFHRSQLRVLLLMVLQYGFFILPVLGAVSPKTRQSKGVSGTKERLARISRPLSLPLIWLLSRGPFERYFMRLLWGPDGVKLITQARELHKKAKAVAGKQPAPLSP